MYGFSILLAVSFLLSAVGPVHASVESLAAASASDFRLLGVFKFDETGPVKVAMGAGPARRPHFGTIRGVLNGSPLEFLLDRRGWKITGMANNALIDIAIDHDNKTITGRAPGGDVDIKFEWKPEENILTGKSGARQISLRVGLLKGSLYGYIGESIVQLDYDKAAGTIKGYVENFPATFKYDALSGRMTGTLKKSRIELVLVNIEIADFLQYFFLFLK